MTYEISISIDTGSAFAQVGELLKELNTHLAKMGCREQLSSRSDCIKATLTTERELIESEIEKVKEIIESQFTEGQPAWKAKVESFRRKSGNVQQLVA